MLHNREVSHSMPVEPLAIPALREGNVKPYVVVVLPAYNAARTLVRTYRDIPQEVVDDVILVDDASQDDTVEIARLLNLKVIQHDKNLGYGGNQKTCYRAALESGAGIVVMVHPDYQYDPTLIPQMIAPIQNGKADCVLGSRMLQKGGASAGGMPIYKQIGNRFLTKVENLILGQNLSEYHTGYRAYSRRLLLSIPFTENSNNFVFDTEIIIQLLVAGFRIKEIPIPTRYFAHASSVDLARSVQYGLAILKRLAFYLIWKAGGRQYFAIAQPDPGAAPR
jgi:glycosyltransferase involved in cell wall biosynthesis